MTDMIRNFQNKDTRRIMTKMLGNMTPAEITKVIQDKEVTRSDIPEWVELVLQENCSIIRSRITLYEDKIQEKFGTMKYLVQKLSVYHLIWNNWDGDEPCPVSDPMPLAFFFDTSINERIMAASVMQ